MTAQIGPAPPDNGWWAIDVAGYLLTQIEMLRGQLNPSTLQQAVVIRWIRDKELDWAPGCADLRNQVPWGPLRDCSTDAALVDFALTEAAAELKEAIQTDGSNDLCPFAARRFLPLGTIEAYGCQARQPREIDIDSADGHVHQGAALPIEVTLRWVADRVTNIGGAPEGPPPMTDTGGVEFYPLPLLALLRALTENSEWLTRDPSTILELVIAGAKGNREKWDKLNSMIAFAQPEDMEVPDLPSLVRAKKDARRYWDEWRYTALLRVEAILLAAVTQREGGLDIFVEQFERLGSIRRSLIPKKEKADYFQKSIANHVEQSESKLTALELRLGEPVSTENVDKGDVEKDYISALSGYRGHIKKTNRPIRVTFPWGLVKSRPGTIQRPTNWRFNPRGIYALTEVVLDVLDSHPALADFIDGIDVCGLEEGEPNWLFAPAFERFATRTAHLTPIPACRFHAGEWQWTPLHGLRRIAEFLRFKTPPGTPRRIGHGLALHSNNWIRIGIEPADELLDDLLWARERLEQIDDVPAALRRSVDRLILDLREVVYSDPEARTASASELVDAYAARFEADALVKVSFLSQDKDGRLSFGDRNRPCRTERRLRLLIAHLTSERTDPPEVSAILGSDELPGVSIHSLRATLADVYDLLAPEIIDDVRWEGVVVEACPTSNVVAGDVRGYVKHPMRHLISKGVLMTLNTDDPSIFHAWMLDELGHAEQRMSVPKRQVRSSRELGLRLVAPGLASREAIISRVDGALASLEGRPPPRLTPR